MEKRPEISGVNWIFYTFLAAAALIFLTNFLRIHPYILYFMTGVFIFCGFYLSRSIKKSAYELIRFSEKIESGDFNAIKQESGKHMFSGVQQILFNFAQNYEKQILKIITDAHRLSAVYSEMQIIISDFLYKAETMNQVSDSIAVATDEMSVNSLDVSSATEHASENINIISTNTREMTTTINEISMNSEKARGVASQAVKSVGHTTQKVTELGNNASAISKIINVIEDISDQTKLLALNATIEAARAGEAGKGFAVVANEVKELAGQTAEATEDIKKSIYKIQGSSVDASIEIQKINDIINDVEENISLIATAVEEQNVTTSDISNNINKAAVGMKDITNSIAQSAEAAQLIARDMVKISMGSKQMLADGTNINNQIKSINKISGNLDRFSQTFTFSADKQKVMSKMVEFAKLLQAREGDHLKWVKKVQNAIVERERKIDVQKDPALCGMGKFLNSAARKEIEKENPKMARIFRDMDEPHNKLHRSAIQLEEMLQNPEISDSEIENFYNATTVTLLTQLLKLFHEAADENFNTLKN